MRHADFVLTDTNDALGANTLRRARNFLSDLDLHIKTHTGHIRVFYNCISYLGGILPGSHVELKMVHFSWITGKKFKTE